MIIILNKNLYDQKIKKPLTSIPKVIGQLNKRPYYLKHSSIDFSTFKVFSRLLQ